MIRTFTSFEEYIGFDRREGNQMAYIKFEALINKWINEEREEKGLPPLGKVKNKKSQHQANQKGKEEDHQRRW